MIDRHEVCGGGGLGVDHRFYAHDGQSDSIYCAVAELTLQRSCSVSTGASITGSSSMSETLPVAEVAAITINLSFSSDNLPS